MAGGSLALVLALLGGWALRRRGARAGDDAPPRHSGNSQFDPALLPQYSPLNVGNDASARPWERLSGTEPLPLSTVTGSPSGHLSAVPEGFDAEGFLRDSKANFVGLQAAWDRADVAALRAMMTENMLAEIQAQLAERERTGGRNGSVSEVVMIEAQLLDIEELPDRYMASVEFSGLMREGVGAGPNPFRELWNITRAKAGEGRWLVAGVQAMQ
ncbi:MAG: Tim44 domain-containing protein [Burkholderiales bacterium]|nr:MAG: Tim44 domain-containing protein [Burkholderiales bacterium]